MNVNNSKGNTEILFSDNNDKKNLNWYDTDQVNLLLLLALFWNWEKRIDE